MKNLSFNLLASLLIFMLIMASCKPDYTKLPTDVKKIADLKLNNWFANGKVSLNGQVMAANSVDFNNGTNIDFYKWSEQMFLWITSPKVKLQNSSQYLHHIQIQIVRKEI